MKQLAVFIFPGIQTLDLFGPIEMLAGFDDRIALTMVAESLEPVPTRHGQRILPDKTVDDGSNYDLLLIPGGAVQLMQAADPGPLNGCAQLARMPNW